MAWRWLHPETAKGLGGAFATLSAGAYLALGGPSLGEMAGAAWATFLGYLAMWWLTPPGTSETDPQAIREDMARWLEEHGESVTVAEAAARARRGG